MNGNSLVEVEKIVVEGLDIVPERTGRIRNLVELLLLRLLNEGGLLDQLERGEIRVPAPPFVERSLQSGTDHQIAETIVERILDALHGPIRRARQADEGV